MAVAAAAVVLAAPDPAAATSCQGCLVVSAPTIGLNAVAQPGLQAVIDQQGGVAVYTPLTTGAVGEPGTLWLVGHRTTHGSVFNRVPTLQPGDFIDLIDDAGAHRYVVNRLLVVSETGFRDDVDINDMSRSMLILQTSHPDSHLRYLVEAFGTGLVPTEITATLTPTVTPTEVAPTVPPAPIPPAQPARTGKFGSIKA